MQLCEPGLSVKWNWTEDYNVLESYLKCLNEFKRLSMCLKTSSIDCWSKFKINEWIVSSLQFLSYIPKREHCEGIYYAALWRPLRFPPVAGWHFYHSLGTMGTTSLSKCRLDLALFWYTAKEVGRLYTFKYLFAFGFNLLRTFEFRTSLGTSLLLAYTLNCFMFVGSNFRGLSNEKSHVCGVQNSLT